MESDYLAALIRRHLDEARRHRPAGTNEAHTELDEETRRQLDALGYIGGNE